MRSDPATEIAGIRINVFTACIIFAIAAAYFVIAPKGREQGLTMYRDAKAAELGHSAISVTSTSSTITTTNRSPSPIPTKPSPRPLPAHRQHRKHPGDHGRSRQRNRSRGRPIGQAEVAHIRRPAHSPALG